MDLPEPAPRLVDHPAFDSAREAHKQGRLGDAAAGYATAAVDFPDDARLARVRGGLALQLGRPREAVDLLGRALELEPDHGESMGQLGLAYCAAGAPLAAEGWLHRSLEAEPAVAATWSNLAMVYLELRRFAQAERSARRALDLDGDLVQAHANLGMSLSRRGQLAAAEGCFRAALARDPSHVQAWAGLSNVGRFHAGSTEPGRLRALIRSGRLSPYAAEAAQFALGRMLDGMERYPEAFAAFTEANRLRHQRVGGGFEMTELERRYGVLRAFDPGPGAVDWRAEAPEASPEPLFIIGFPRSGTSLVERILSGHPDVVAGGELVAMHRLAQDVGAPRCLQPAELHRLRKAYRAAVARRRSALGERAGGERPKRITDKLPHNFEHLWLVAQLFPRATVVHCMRDPVDTCVSCFTHDFALAHPYKNTLDTLGRSWVLYRDLVAHWARVLPVRLVEVQYADLVGDPADRARALVQACGLSWAPACLSFAGASRQVPTLDPRAQAHETVVEGSVGRSRRFGACLDPLRSALGQGAPPESGEPGTAR